MDTFDFPYHVLGVKYPESSVTLQFGKGYSFASKPKGPDQVTYTLDFEAMVFIESEPGTLDTSSNPKLNMAILEAFYTDHRLYEPFIYPHPTLGDLTVRFSEPLSYKILKGGRGLTEPFTITLVTQP